MNRLTTATQAGSTRITQSQLEPLALATDLSIAVTLRATGIGIGVRHGRASLGDRPWRLPFLAVVGLNTAGVPLAVGLLLGPLGLAGDGATGIVLIAAAAGDALGLKTTQIAGGDIRLALPLVLVLELANLVTIPAWTSLLLPAGSAPPILEIARTVVLLVLLPLFVGGQLCTWRPGAVVPICRVLDPLATVSLVVVMALVLWPYTPLVMESIGSGLPAAAALLVVGCLVAGALVSGQRPRACRTVALVTAGRANALALVVAQTSYADRPGVAVAAVMVGLGSVGGAHSGRRRASGTRDGPGAGLLSVGVGRLLLSHRGCRGGRLRGGRSLDGHRVPRDRWTCVGSITWSRPVRAIRSRTAPFACARARPMPRSSTSWAS